MSPSPQRARGLLIGSAMLASFAAGFILGGTQQLPRPQSSGQLTPPRSEPMPGREAADAPASATRSETAAASAMDFLADPRIRAAEIASRSGDPIETARALIDSLSERDVVALVSSVTSLPEREVDGLRDVRGFAKRLSSIALDGVLNERADDAADVADVQFADFVDPLDRPLAPRSHFPPGTERIYAVFPTEDYALGDVVVKWYRTDPTEVLLFGRYPIRRDQGQGHVWLEKPRGWAEGDYRVEFYSGDPALVKLASGSYAIEAHSDR